MKTLVTCAWSAARSIVVTHELTSRRSSSTRRAFCLAPSCQRARPRGEARLQFRAQDSNLSSWLQRPVSCRLDDPGVGGGEAPAESRGTPLPWPRRGSRRRRDAAVGPEGFEPSPPRLRVECAYPFALRTHDDARRVERTRTAMLRGTRGGRTLIPRVKSPVLGRLS